MNNKKRRRSKDNPYKMDCLGNKYKINFKYNGENKEIKISKELYDLFNKFELEDLSYMNKYDRHIEHLQLDEIQMYNRLKLSNKNLEDEVIKDIENQDLHIAIKKLPQIQRRRIYLYYFCNMKQREIALQENTTIRAIQYSLDKGIKNLKKFLKLTS